MLFTTPPGVRRGRAAAKRPRAARRRDPPPARGSGLHLRIGERSRLARQPEEAGDQAAAHRRARENARIAHHVYAAGQGVHEQPQQAALPRGAATLGHVEHATGHHRRRGRALPERRFEQADRDEGLLGELEVRLLRDEIGVRVVQAGQLMGEGRHLDGGARQAAPSSNGARCPGRRAPRPSPAGRRRRPAPMVLSRPTPRRRSNPTTLRRRIPGVWRGPHHGALSRDAIEADTDGACWKPSPNTEETPLWHTQSFTLPAA